MPVPQNNLGCADLSHSTTHFLVSKERPSPRRCQRRGFAMPLGFAKLSDPSPRLKVAQARPQPRSSWELDDRVFRQRLSKDRDVNHDVGASESRLVDTEVARSEVDFAYDSKDPEVLHCEMRQPSLIGRLRCNCRRRQSCELLPSSAEASKVRLHGSMLLRVDRMDLDEGNVEQTAKSSNPFSPLRLFLRNGWYHHSCLALACP